MVPTKLPEKLRRPGAIPIDKYTYGGDLGRGAWGRVIVGIGPDGERLALKAVPPSERDWLISEFESLGRVSHPRLARVLDLFSVPTGVPGLGIEPGAWMLVEEIVSGAALDEQAKRLSFPDSDLPMWCVQRIAEAAEGLAALHEVDLLHGDLKPANILVDERMGARLIDLGLASTPGSYRRAAGTPGYMAPELLAGERTHASDLYALGMCFARALLARDGTMGTVRTSSSRDASGHEVAAGTSGGLWLASREHAIRDLRAQSFPAPILELVESMIQVAPDERPASAREVVARCSWIAGKRSIRGVQPEPNANERAARIPALPLVGRDVAVRMAEDSLADGARTLFVLGSSGAGRSRFVRELVKRAQVAAARGGALVPEYVSIGTEEGWEACVAFHSETQRPRFVHLSISHPAQAHAVVAFQRALALSGCDADVLIVEQLASDSVHEGTEHVQLGPLARPDFDALAKRIDPTLATDGIVLDRLFVRTGGLPGLLCRGAVASLRSADSSSLEVCIDALASSDPLDLTGPARSLALVAAAVGGAVSPRILQELRGSPAGHSWIAARRALVERGLATTRSDGALCLRPAHARSLRALAGKEVREKADAVALHVGSDVASRAYVALARRDADVERTVCDAARRLRATGHVDEATTLLEVAVEEGARARSRGERLDQVRALLADVLRSLGKYDAALLAIEGLASAAVLRADIARHQGKLEVAAAELAAHPPEDAGRGLHAAVWARVDYDGGHHESAATRAVDALAWCSPEDYVARFRALEVQILLANSQQADATQLLVTLTDSAKHAGLAFEARAAFLAGLVAQSRSERASAASCFERAAHLARTANERHLGALAEANAGVVLLEEGILGDALVQLRGAARQLVALGRDRDVARALYNLANAAILVGDRVLAGWAHDRFRELCERHPALKTAPEAARFALVMAESEGRHGDIRAALARLEEVASASLPVEETILVRARRALWLACEGQQEAANVCLAEARAMGSEILSSETGPSAISRELDLASAFVLRASGDYERASSHARALSSDENPFEYQLRGTLLLAHLADDLSAHEDAALQRSRVRTLLELASRSLDGAGRSRLRAVPEYAAALAAASVADRTGVSRGVDVSPRSGIVGELIRRLDPELGTTRVIENALDALMERFDAERVAFARLSDDGSIRVVRARGLRGMLKAESETVSRTLVNRALTLREVIRTIDAVHETASSESVQSLALRSAMIAPLRTESSVLVIEDRLRRAAFSDADAKALEELAALVGIALRSARLIRAAHATSARLSTQERRLSRLVESQGLELDQLRRRTDSAPKSDLIGSSTAISRLLELTRRAAASSAPVLILGESGVGKELVARSIHAMSARSRRSFVAENAGAIPDGLLESALFGHVRGAFTGAERARMGLFEAADHGTLFLDEVAEMSAAMQAKLLRVVQSGELRALGSERSRNVDVRLITATHRSLSERIAQGLFREDLFYRLSVVVIEVPPLRDRIEDVPELVAHFLEKQCAVAKRATPLRIDPKALACLMSYRWPGNVRQLENELLRASVVADDVIRAEHLSPQIGVESGEEPIADLDLKAQTAALEKRLIRRALEEVSGNQTKAAAKLGVSRFGLQKMMLRLGLTESG